MKFKNQKNLMGKFIINDKVKNIGKKHIEREEYFEEIY